MLRVINVLLLCVINTFTDVLIFMSVRFLKTHYLISHDSLYLNTSVNVGRQANHSEN